MRGRETVVCLVLQREEEESVLGPGHPTTAAPAHCLGPLLHKLTLPPYLSELLSPLFIILLMIISYPRTTWLIFIIVVVVVNTFVLLLAHCCTSESFPCHTYTATSFDIAETVPDPDAKLAVALFVPRSPSVPASTRFPILLITLFPGPSLQYCSTCQFQNARLLSHLSPDLLYLAATFAL